MSEVNRLLCTLLCLANYGGTVTGDNGGTMMCNASPDLCYLKFNQVSFAGTHNSGSGYRGQLQECPTGNKEEDCIWRNQNLSITEQLNLGIRFLEIDLCLLPSDCMFHINDNGDTYTGASLLFTCYKRDTAVRYAGPVMEVFQQVNDWMGNNPNDVIGLYFPAESPLDEKADIVADLQDLLEEMWLSAENTTKPVYMSTHYNRNEEWPTLAEAITTNERIFVFIDPALSGESEHTDTMPWNHPSVFSTYVRPSQDLNLCEERLFQLAQSCNATEDILIEAGVSLGICLNTVQDNCNMALANATYDCYNLRILQNQTVNIVAVDYPERDSSTVFDIVSYLNEENIRRYPPTTTAPTGTGPTTSGTGPITSETDPMSSSTIVYSCLYTLTIALLLALCV